MEVDSQQPLDQNDSAQSITVSQQDPSLSPPADLPQDPQQEQRSQIPVAGFTSAFFYDPYVEIKEFLDALSPAIHGHAAPIEPAESSEVYTVEKLLPGIPVADEDDAKSVQNNPSTAATAVVEATPAVGNEANSRDKAKEEMVDGNALREAVSKADLVNECSTDEPKSMANPCGGPSTGVPSDNSASSSSGSGEEGASTHDTSSNSIDIVASTTNSSIVDSAVDKESPADSLPPPKKETEQVGPSNTSQELQQQLALTASRPVQNDFVHSTNSTAAAPSLGFAASITASFAPETRSAWAQLFGARYEDEVESNTVKSSDSPPDSPSAHQLERGPKPTVSKEISRVSLKTRLDQQIQASRQKFQERTLRNARSNDSESHSPTSRLNPHHSSIAKPTRTPIKPFEHAGLTITKVRFCIEKALQATCACFQQLHAIAVNESLQIPSKHRVVEHGVFVTQWELEQLLHELFGPQRDAMAFSSVQRPLALAHPDYAGAPLELLLQATWFIPFDQLPRLRSLVLQITRKHLNESKLAVLNRQLQTQLLLVPYSARLQRALLNFSERKSREENEDDESDDDKSTGSDMGPPSLLHCTHELVRELLECINVRVSIASITELVDNEFLLLCPRVVFFRFLIETIAKERANTTLCEDGRNRTSSDTKTPVKVAAMPQDSKLTNSVRSVKSRTRKKKHIRRKSNQSDSSSDASGDSSRTKQQRKASMAVSQGSAASSSFAAASHEERHSPRSALTTRSPQRGTKQLLSLQQTLWTSLANLKKAMPWVLQDDPGKSDVSPAIKATFLAASAFHQSLDVMIKSELALDCDVMDKLQSFIESLDAIVSNNNESTVPNGTAQSYPIRAAPMHPAVAAATVVTKSFVRQDTLYPPPYPDLTPEEEGALFPPPYASFGPAYWTFNPDIPPPSAAKPGTSGSSSTAPIHPPLYPVHPSPGVGAYDLEKSKRVRFHQSPRFSFRKAGVDAAIADTPAKGMNSTSSVSSTLSKPRLYKTALSRPPSTPNRNEEMHNHDLDYTQKRSNGSLLDETSSNNNTDANFRVMAPSEIDENDDDAGDDRLEVDMLLALRRQHNMVVNDFMQDILQQQQSRRPTSPDPPPFEDSHMALGRKSKLQQHAPRLATERNWRSSSTSRFVSRLRSRETISSPEPRQQQRPQRVSTSSDTASSPSKKTRATKKGTPQAQRNANSVTVQPRVSGLEQPNDEHLAWAVRISEFYNAKRSIDTDD